MKTPSPYMTDQENLFFGKWKVVGFCTYDPEIGWSNPKPYPPRGVIWEFIHKRQIRFPVGQRKLAYQGELRRYSGHVSGKEITEYTYFPDMRKLLIEPCPEAPEGYMNRYHVEKTGENEYWLHDLETEQEHFQGQYMRLRFRKL